MSYLNNLIYKLEIVNYVLEINNIIMKSKFNSYTPFIWSAVSIFLLSIWLYQTDKSFDMVAYAILGLSVLIIGINLYIKIKGFKEERMGLASEDELSKGIKEKAAAKAFRYSIFMWVFIILFFIEIEPKAKIVIGIGVLGMAVVFLLTWLYLSMNGIAHEDKD